MDTRTAQLYDLLIDKGFDRDKVKEALSELVTKGRLGASRRRLAQGGPAELELNEFRTNQALSDMVAFRERRLGDGLTN